MTVSDSDLAAFRFGFGLPLPDDMRADPLVQVGALRDADAGIALWPGPDAREVLDLHATWADARDARRAANKRAKELGVPSTADDPQSPEREAIRAALQAIGDQNTLFMRLSIARALDSPQGMRERLVQFWQDHFTTLQRGRENIGIAASRADHAIRPHIAGRFGDLLRAAILHPSMLLALDQTSSVGPNSPYGSRRKLGLNENLARELIELHTLGVEAAYSQTDVRQLAELLTGLDFVPRKGMIFHDNRAEPGAEEVLGTSYAGRDLAPVYAVLDDLAVRPETAAHLCRKLCVHFLSDEPEPALVEDMARVWQQTGGEMIAVLEVMARSPAARSTARTKARRPFEFITGALRALGISGAGVMAMRGKTFNTVVRRPLMAMGQPWDTPPGPDGWPEEAAAWITPQGLAGRIAWSMTAPRQIEASRLPDARSLVTRALGSLAGDGLIQAVARSDTDDGGVGLILSSPEFNRR